MGYTVTFHGKNTGLLKNIVADGVMNNMPHRFFVDFDGVRFEVPVDGNEFTFSKERTKQIQEHDAERAAAEAAAKGATQ